MKKYISYMITVGGDAGWRFSNREEWCSCEYMLYFDASLWTIDSIAKEINKLWNAYWYGERHHGWTYRETFDIGMKYIAPFINTTEGVFVETKSFSAVNTEKKITPKSKNVERWTKDGYEYNGDYDRKL